MYNTFIRNIVSSAVCALSLSACASVNPAGLIAARALDPLNAAPGDIALAVGVPRTIRLADGDAQFRIAFSGGNGASAVVVDETVPLQVARVTNQNPPPHSDGEVVYAARFSPENAARVSAAQDEIKALRARGVEGQGSISVAVRGGCIVEPPLITMPVSTWLQTNPDNGFVSLTTEQDALQGLDDSQAAALRDNFQACP